MPNWCENRLTILGDKDALEKFQSEARLDDCPLSFEKFIPTPPELLEGEGWYDWRLKNWGTKWDLSDDGCFVEESKDGELRLRFDTAWSPPSEAITKISARYPGLVFHLEYAEEGCYFEGAMTCRNGDILSLEEGDFGARLHWTKAIIAEREGEEGEEGEEGDKH